MYQNNPYNYYQPNPQQIQEMMRQQAYYKMKREEEKSEIRKKGLILGSAVFAYILLSNIIAVLVYKSGYYDAIEKDTTLMYSFNMIVAHFIGMGIPFGAVALLCRKKFTCPIIPMAKLGAAKTFSWVSLGIGICMASNVITNMVINLFKSNGYELTQPDFPKISGVEAIIVMAVATAVVPALFEEFSMRCCALGLLLSHGKAFSVVAVSIVFGLLHGNVIQFIFAFLIGLVLGYITIVTDSVVPAMLIHGFNNGLSVFSETLTYTSGKEVANKALTAVVMVWIVLAIIGLVYLAANKELLPRKEYKVPEPYALSFGAKLACLMPGFILPFIYLIIVTLTSIKRIS